MQRNRMETKIIIIIIKAFAKIKSQTYFNICVFFTSIERNDTTTKT